jgi:ParB family transcriptional regulator, chromosome partitioning protein
MAQQGGLGRGLASLIPKKKKDKPGTINYFGSETSIEENSDKKPIIKSDKTTDEITEGSHYQESGGNQRIADISLRSIIEAPIGSVLPNPHQPRLNFDEQKLQELSDSIKTHGVLQPLVVSRRDDGKYELIAGERRLEASKIAGLLKVPVVVRKATEQNKMELALIENVQRHNLSVMEEAKAYKKMQDTFALTQEEIASRVGKSRSNIANVLRLLNLPVEMQRAISEGKISEGHARTILALSNPEKQRALFDLILKEKLTVRETEGRVRDVTVKTHPKRIRSIDPETQQKEQSLSETLGTKVKIKKSKKGGQILIDFYSEEEFSSLHNKLATLA